MSVIAKSFAEIFNTDKREKMNRLSDGTLQANDGTNFRIHKAVLSQRSDYFLALFSFDLNQETVVFPNIDSKTLESILIYIYTGKIALDEKNVCDIIIASDFLLLDDLLKMCRSLMIQNMTTTNCLPFLTVAFQINGLAIYEDCVRYVLVNFTDILETSIGGLEGLPFEILKKLLDSKGLNVVSERTVWEVIISWTEANSSVRLPHVPILLTCIKLNEEDENLATEILSHNIVSRNPHFSGIMLSNQFNFEILKNSILSQQASLEPLYQNLPNSYGPRMPNHLHLVARHILSYEQRGSELFLSYDNEIEFWRQVETEYSFVDSMLQVGRYIYMFEKQIMVNIFDIIEEAWVEREIPPMPIDSDSDDAIVGWTITLGEKLYYIDRDFDFTNSIYSYEFERNSWECITIVSDIDVNGAVALKDQIFIVGCAYEVEDVIMCRAYDPEKKAWISLPAPNIVREDFFLAVYHEKVFLIPSNWENNSKTVEVYDPVQNTWMLLSDLPFKYEFPKAVIADDKLIVYESTERETRRFQQVNPPVCWDENAELWRIINESSPWYRIELYTLLVLDDCRLVKDITSKHRRPGNEWRRIFPA